MRTPIVATWLLRHFGSSRNNESVIGDLVEQFEWHQSRLWYWRQVLTTIAVSIVRYTSDNKWRTLMSFASGWGVLYVFVLSKWLLTDLLLGLDSWSRYWRHWWIQPVTLTTFLLLMCALSGWVVARRADGKNGIVLVYAISVFMYGWGAFFYAGSRQIVQYGLVPDFWAIARHMVADIPVAAALNGSAFAAILLGGLLGSVGTHHTRLPKFTKSDKSGS